MGERRKRKSLWDKEAETKHFSGMSENSYRTGKEHHSSHDSGQYRDFSSSGSYRAPNFRYHSGQPSFETIEDDPVSPMNGSFSKNRERVHEGREMGGESRYYQKMSPDFRSNHSLGNDRSHSYRYPGRGRSRSPRGRSPSRSLSRGRERERPRERRSRSRSRGDDMAEPWRNRTAHGAHMPRHSYSSSRGSRTELREDVSDPYYGEDDQVQNRSSRSAIPCKDFVKGNCRWGDSCRFSHHFASDDQQPYRNGKPLCKYFAAGRCERDNCRFSHEDSRFNNLEGRQGKFTDEGSLGNENRNWKLPERTHNFSDRDNRPHPTRNVTYGGDFAVVESIGLDNMDKKQEALLFKDGGDLKVQEPNRIEDSWEAWGDDSQVSHVQQPSQVSHVQQPSQVSHIQQPSQVSHIQPPSQVTHIQPPSPVSHIQPPSPVSHIQQLSHSVVENNPVSTFRSDVVHDELKDPRNLTVPVLAGENLSPNGEDVFSGRALVSSKTHIGQNLPYPNPSNLVTDLHLQPQMQNHQKTIQTTELLKAGILDFLPKIVTSESTPQFTIPITLPTQGLENEHARKDLDTQIPNLMGVPLFETTNVQSFDPINPIENERGTNEQGKPTEEDDRMEIEQSSPLPVAGGEPDNSEDHSGKPKQEPVVANSEVDEGKVAPGEESKGDKNDKHAETLDGHGKNEESNANKDDKGMRLFKNSLIEFVKDILKPTWKEGRMSREVHKTIVKKVVDKVTSTIQADHIPKTQEKVEQYLSYSQPKIAKLVQAYVGRSQKTDS